jgi:hypothetical protein
VSNQTRLAFAKSMGSSVVSRIHEAGEVIECEWGSFRKPDSVPVVSQAG